MQEFSVIVAQSLTHAFKRLLSEKHLYQSVEVDLSAIPKIAHELRHTLAKPLTSNMRERGPRIPSTEDVTRIGMQTATRSWEPANPSLPGARPIPQGEPDYIEFQLPTINTFCTHCEANWPFNPIFDTYQLTVRALGQHQWFFLGYQCQQCKGLPVRFLVRREGLKLRLAGRDPIEVLPTPKELPKTQSKYFSDAMVAHHAGQTLAGLFLLRVFIEQFWRTVPAVQDLLKQDSRAPGERQGDAYQSSLPTDFKSRFPSLKDVYARLSEAIHAADAKATLFEEASAKIIEHFEARRLFKIT